VRRHFSGFIFWSDKEKLENCRTTKNKQKQ
jgi:hypothetical protein